MAHTYVFLVLINVYRVVEGRRVRELVIGCHDVEGG